jgi:hypothetical protein
MPWDLTTALQTGGLDAAGPYSQVKVVDFHHFPNRSRLDVRFEWGNTPASDWVGGHVPVGTNTVVSITGTDYDDLIANSVPDVQTSDPSDANYAQVGAVWVERTYYAVKRAIYEWLNTNGKIGAGSIS